MQSKGAIKFVAILFALACLFQLSFTAVTYYQEGKAAKYAETVVESAKNTPEFAAASSAKNGAFYLDSVATTAQKIYLDSISSKNVYLGFTYKQVKERELNLGLDLKGGMNVVLQLDLADLVRSCARSKVDAKIKEQFDTAMTVAAEKASKSHEDFITLFKKEWDAVDPAAKMSRAFDLDRLGVEVKDKTKLSNEEIISLLEKNAESVIDNSYNVVERRVNQFGVAQPNIQKIARTGRILVELPGVKEPERVRKLLQGTASLEFWQTYTYQDLAPYIQELNEALLAQAAEAVQAPEAAEADAAQAEPAQTEASQADSSALASLEAEVVSSQAEPAAEAQAAYQAVLLQSPYGSNSACLGLAHYRDTAAINAALAKITFPGDFVPAWSFKAFNGGGVQPDTYFELIALKSVAGKGAALDGSVVTSARVNFDQITNAAEVSMNMNSVGAARWSVITEQNINHQIAIVMDGQVYSYPNVQAKISGGSSQITGNFTQAEANDLATVLKSGKLKTAARIVQEQVVGPSLGSASIKAGMISFLIAFCLVLIYMVIFYRRAGLAADIALLCNVLFLFGALASFGAVLTLPGIAGLVLTMGMAVDANVIIYERVKEELNAGKALRLAITDGYKNAYSAILDGQITTLLTGLILAIFGSGTVKGFAIVLVMGIITSVLTSIFIPRLIFEHRLDKNRNISFYTSFSKNFLKNTHINFIDARKVSYTVSLIVCIGCIISCLTKGFTYGVDFSGGRTYVVRFDAPVTPEQVRQATFTEFGEAAEVKQFGGASQMRITTKYKIDDESSETDKEIEGKLYNALNGFFAEQLSLNDFTSTLDNPNGIISSDRVDASIASEVQRDAVIAVILALVVIFAYIAIRFKNWTWGMGGVTSLAHNAVIVIGFFSIFTGVLPFTLDVDQQFIAAVLTIIGYSINDNVVIFDRIREYRTLYPKRELKQNVNDALNSTLSRTINTSVTTLVVLLAIAIWGGESIRGFAVALTVGVVVGTYASIFIGTPVMYDLYMKKLKKQQGK